MDRAALIEAATEEHDRAGCRCDRKYLMSCVNLAAAILRVGAPRPEVPRPDPAEAQ